MDEFLLAVRVSIHTFINLWKIALCYHISACVLPCEPIGGFSYDLV
jgi:hypothetical protein